MRIVITSGPSYAGLDEIRRLTNSSTGELGTLLAETFAEQGHKVTLYRALGSTYPAPLWPVETLPFSTNEDLKNQLEKIPQPETVTAVFHVAALCDFQVKDITTMDGHPVMADKISSRLGSIRLILEPAPKLITQLRQIFPTSLIVGWKYELDGSLAHVVAKGKEQMEENLTDACVLNGKAYGPGFGVLGRSGERVHLPDKPALCDFLKEWLERIPGGNAASGPESFHALATLMPLGPFL